MLVRLKKAIDCYKNRNYRFFSAKKVGTIPERAIVELGGKKKSRGQIGAEGPRRQFFHVRHDGRKLLVLESDLQGAYKKVTK